MPLSRITGPSIANNSVIIEDFASARDTAVYSPAANTVAIRTASADRVVLNSSGNIGMGSAGTTAAADIHINDTMSSNTAYHTAMILQGQAATGPTGSSSSGGIELQFRGRTDGAIANSTIASIGGYINTNAVNNAGGIFFRGQESAGTGLVPIFRVNQDGLVLLKGSTANGGAGIAFPASQSASSDPNTLDDYEEGTWTPSSLNSVSDASGRYTKIGRVVQWSCRFTYGGSGSGLHAYIGGLPFVCANAEAARAGSSIGYTDYGSTNITVLFASNDVSAFFYNYSGGALSYANLSGRTIYCGGTYLTNT